MTAPDTDHARLPVPPPVIFGLSLVLSVGLHLLIPYPLYPATPFRIVGVALLLAAAGLSGWAKATLNLAGTSVRPDKPTFRLVTDGPYRFTRNPLYLSLCLLQAGGAMLIAQLQPLIMTAVLAMALQQLAIIPEEEYLKKRFGSKYDDYCQRVRRWF